MAASRLPPEMIKAIIDHLHDDKQTLQTCSLVCKAWTHPTRLNLFARLTLKWPLQPAVFPFVRHLRFFPSHELFGNDAVTWNESLLQVVGLPRIVSLNVDRLWSLSATDIQMLSTLGKNLSGIVSLSLSLFCYTDVPSLARVICAFPCLRALSMTGLMRPVIAEALKSEPRCPTTLRLPPHLCALDIDIVGVTSLLEWLLSLPVRPALRTFCLREAGYEDFSIVQNFIGALGNDLESFTVSSLTGLDQVDITPLTRLRSIQFLLSRKNLNRWIFPILSQISTAHVEDVLFQLPPYVHRRHFELSDVLEWSEVDAILQRPTFSRLRNVELRRYVSQWESDTPPDVGRSFSDELRKCLPRCHARGIL